MIHLDTHAVVWLYQGDTARFPPSLLDRIGYARPYVSPMVRVELALLHEIGRLTVPANAILDALAEACDLQVSEVGFARTAQIAATLSWTRDPFDRLIAAQALAEDLPLVTRDATMLAHCRVAVWA